ncbi:MAG: hypothetical protein Kow0022_07380 [Phycisphaerales bacterium]
MSTLEARPERRLGSRFVRVVFVCYAVALAVLTHWPRLTIPGSVPNSDLMVHAAAFGVWTLLLFLCRFFGPASSMRNVLFCAATAVAYAMVDELTQLIPAVQRHAAPQDFLADVIGVGAATIAAGLASMSFKQKGAVHGPLMWIISLVIGLLVGGLLTTVIPTGYEQALELSSPEPRNGLTPGADSSSIHSDPSIEFPSSEPAQPRETAHAGGESHDVGHKPHISIVLCLPFVLLLMSIALMPFINARIWHHHFPDFSFFLGGVVVGYYIIQFNVPYQHGMSYGLYQMVHVGREYVAFIALVGGLFVASGGVLIDIRGRGRPLANTLLLGFGAILANIVGTTGASMLLIRPFMRLNAGRLHAIHIVLFIFIISNCGGALTPIGDPPLYLGYLKGVPFFWTLSHLLPMWAVAVGTLLVTFFIIDTIVDRRTAPPQLETAMPSGGYSVRVRGAVGMIALAIIIGAVFIDPFLSSRFGVEGIPVGPIVQIVVAIVAHRLAPREILDANEFSFFPVKEVGLLFVGIFATMAPALGYLAQSGAVFDLGFAQIHLQSGSALYFGTGCLSAFLDNAPTYANFLQIAYGSGEMTRDGVLAFVLSERGAELTRAVSLGAVFFGAFTYIGNGPNFMVKAIADASGVQMPSFFGYTFRAILFLTPALLLVWAIFIR